MGMESAAIIMAAVAVGSEVGKIGFQMKAAEAKEKALELQGKQLQLETTQKSLSNYDVMEKMLDAQIAHMTTTGTAFSSPSYNAIQRNTMNIGGRKGRNIELEGQLALENIEQEKRNVRSTLYAQLFGEVSNAAMSAYNIHSKMPTLKE